MSNKCQQKIIGSKVASHDTVEVNFVAVKTTKHCRSEEQFWTRSCRNRQCTVLLYRERKFDFHGQIQRIPKHKILPDVGFPKTKENGIVNTIDRQSKSFDGIRKPSDSYILVL